jgi:hypothetical protein
MRRAPKYIRRALSIVETHPVVSIREPAGDGFDGDADLIGESPIGKSLAAHTLAQLCIQPALRHTGTGWGVASRRLSR